MYNRHGWKQSKIISRTLLFLRSLSCTFTPSKFGFLSLSLSFSQHHSCCWFALIHFKCKILNVYVWWHNERPKHCNKIIDECCVCRSEREKKAIFDSWATAPANQAKNFSHAVFDFVFFFVLGLTVNHVLADLAILSAVQHFIQHESRKPAAQEMIVNSKSNGSESMMFVLFVFSWRWLPDQVEKNV